MPRACVGGGSSRTDRWSRRRRVGPRVWFQAAGLGHIPQSAHQSFELAGYRGRCQVIHPRPAEKAPAIEQQIETACLDATGGTCHALVLLVRHIAQESQRDVDIGGIDHSRAGFAKFAAGMAGDFYKPRAQVPIRPQGEEQPSDGFAHRRRFTIRADPSGHCRPCNGGSAHDRP